MSSSFLDYYNTVVGSIGGITITGLGLVFHILASSDGVQPQGPSVGILRIQISS